MRLIGTLTGEKEAYAFSAFLLRQGIQCKFEPFEDKGSKEKGVRIWVENEDDFPQAFAYLEEFTQDPENPHFKVDPLTFSPPPRLESEVKNRGTNVKSPFKIKIGLRPKGRFGLTLTTFIIGLCVFLFFLDTMQRVQLEQESGPLAIEAGVTPLDAALVFDYPYATSYFAELLRCYPIKSLDEIKNLPPAERALYEKAEKIPSWRGIYDFLIEWKKTGEKKFTQAPLFEKIRQGEVWRLFTPCLLHGGFLHILFNMAWVWILGRQIEERMSKGKMILLMLIIGIVSNGIQYFMSGPFFLGYSGIVVGMTGFIWMRQKRAPWEGYPLQKNIIVFILIFVLAMFALEFFSFLLQIFSSLQLTANIANTAHIVGGLTGILLGRLSFFARGHR